MSREEDMTFYVYSNRPARYPADWKLAGTSESYEDAKQIAMGLCPKGSEISHEPGNGLDAAFFGSIHSDKWSAMIDVKPIEQR